MFDIKREPKYNEEMVKPMRDELTAIGCSELKTPESVEDVINIKDNKTIMVVINSVCGCAARSARPGMSLALQNKIIPDRLFTVFAGQELDAVDTLRTYIKGYPPSSPSIALFKNGELLFFLPRNEIEGYSPEQVASKLVTQFEKYCLNNKN